MEYFVDSSVISFVYITLLHSLLSCGLFVCKTTNTISMCLCNAAPSYSNPVFKISTDINKTGKVLMLPKEADKSENHAQKWSYPS